MSVPETFTLGFFVGGWVATILYGFRERWWMAEVKRKERYGRQQACSHQERVSDDRGGVCARCGFTWAGRP